MTISQIIFQIISSALDIMIVSVFIYFLLKLLVRSEKHLAILAGIVAFFALAIIANVLELKMTSIIVDNIVSWGVVIFVILFNEEIKEYLEKIGNGSIFTRKVDDHEIQYLDGLANATFKLAENKVGALITIKRFESLNRFTQSSVKLDAEFSEYLIVSLFQKDSPLHDGAVVISDEKISYASVYFPIAIDADLSKELGTRHRAAYTISRETDALSIVVSEETGSVSIAFGGKLHYDVDREFLVELINEKVIQE